MADEVVSAYTPWSTNAELIADCARLGYLHRDRITLDPTYGEGTFWQLWRPRILIGSDLDPAKSPSGQSVDFTNMPHADQAFPVVVFDPPYKLNGTPDPIVDARYGVDVMKRWQDRMGLMRQGLVECARVCSSTLLMKCQDQVSSGKIRWQSFEMVNLASTVGFGLVDRLVMLGGRPQPDGTSQVHARQNASTMLIFKRGWHSSDLPR